MGSSQPIRVLQVFGKLNSGGAETMLMNIYRNIDRSKVQFDFIVHTKEVGFYEQEIKKLGGKIYRVPRFEGKNIRKYIDSWRRLFNEHPEYKIIHSHIRSTASIFLKIAKQEGLTTIAHSHSISNGKGTEAIVKKILQYPIKHIADYLFACSNPAGEWLYGKRLVKKGMVHVVKNAIDTSYFKFKKSTREKYRKDLNITNKFVIGNVARFAHEKNHNFMLEVFLEVYKQNKNAVLILVGEGELLSEIKGRVKSLKLDHVVLFLGVRSDISELMQSMDVFILPSHFEGLGIVAIEAQATGLPTIVSDKVPSEVRLTDIIKFVSLRSNSSGWANEIIGHPKNFNRGETIESIKTAGYDIKENAKKIEQFYLSITKRFVRES